MEREIGPHEGPVGQGGLPSPISTAGWASREGLADNSCWSVHRVGFEDSASEEVTGSSHQGACPARPGSLKLNCSVESLHQTDPTLHLHPLGPAQSRRSRATPARAAFHATDLTSKEASPLPESAAAFARGEAYSSGSQARVKHSMAAHRFPGWDREAVSWCEP
jgi:hypothetical protein